MPGCDYDATYDVADGVGGWMVDLECALGDKKKVLTAKYHGQLVTIW